MKEARQPTQEEFEGLLAWLDENRDNAAMKYENLRIRLIRMFASRGCPVAEELTDETINRVSLKAEEQKKTYVGDPALYFFGVAQNVYKEWIRPRAIQPPDPPPSNDEDHERRLDCLDRCVADLSDENRKCVLEFNSLSGRARINNRKNIADESGITQNALRIRAHRIRKTLRKCVEACLKESIAA